MKTLFSDFLLEDFALSSGHRTCLSTLVTVGSYCLPGLSPISGSYPAITTGMDAWNTSNDGRKPPALSGTQIQPIYHSIFPSPSPRAFVLLWWAQCCQGRRQLLQEPGKRGKRPLQATRWKRRTRSKVPKWSKVVSEQDWTPGFSLPSLLLHASSILNYMTPSNLRTFGASHQDHAGGTWFKSTFCFMLREQVSNLPEVFYTKFDSFHPWKKLAWSSHMFVPTIPWQPSNGICWVPLAELHRPRVVFATPWTCLKLPQPTFGQFQPVIHRDGLNPTWRFETASWLYNIPVSQKIEQNRWTNCYYCGIFLVYKHAVVSLLVI